MTQPELFPKAPPPMPPPEDLWAWLEQARDPKAKQVSFRLARSKERVVFDLTDHTIRVEAVQ